MLALPTQRASTGFSAAEPLSFRYLILRNPPMPLRIAYRRVVGSYRLGVIQKPFEVRCVVAKPSKLRRSGGFLLNTAGAAWLQGYLAHKKLPPP